MPSKEIPLSGWYCPTGHLSQPSLPVSCSNRPTSQFVQILCPFVSWYFPATQSTHAMEYSAGCTNPVSHSLQNVLALASANLPAMHPGHACCAVLPTAYPKGQTRHCSCSIKSFHHPAGQSRQSFCAFCSWCLPFAHSLQRSVFDPVFSS